MSSSLPNGHSGTMLIMDVERITYQAATEGLIPSAIRGVQAQLDSLSKNTDFVSMYNHEIEAGRLRHADVEKCRKSLYHEVSKHAYGNDEVITIRAVDFVPTKLAALISYYKLQDSWDNCLQWQVIKRPRSRLILTANAR